MASRIAGVSPGNQARLMQYLRTLLNPSHGEMLLELEGGGDAAVELEDDIVIAYTYDNDGERVVHAQVRLVQEP